MLLKDLRKKVKQHGYKIRTKTLNSLGGKRFADVYKDGKHIVGSSASAYYSDDVIKHEEAFQIYRDAKEEGVYDKGTKIIL